MLDKGTGRVLKFSAGTISTIQTFRGLNNYLTTYENKFAKPGKGVQTGVMLKPFTPDGKRFSCLNWTARTHSERCGETLGCQVERCPEQCSALSDSIESWKTQMLTKPFWHLLS